MRAKKSAMSLMLLASTAHARAAQALPCETLSNPLYVTGSSAVKPLLAEIAKVLTAAPGASGPVTVVYLGVGSCVGVDAVLNGTRIGGAALSYWDDQGNEQTCSVDPGAGVLTDIGVSDVFASTCFDLPNGFPSNVTDFLGPVQTMTFVVPRASSQLSISAEAAYYVYGFGFDSGAEPWTDETVLFQRNEQSGTQRMIAKAIRLEPGAWHGVSASNSGDMRQKVIAAGNTSAEATLGILATDEADDNRATVKVLAYQHFGQTCGFFPDRDPTSHEKKNVRDGHYVIWGPLHLLTTIDNNGRPTNALAGDVIGYLIGTKPPPAGLDLIYLESQRHVIPQCAMRVARTQEIGPLMPYSPPTPCGCYYDDVSNGSTACTPCDVDSDCAASGIICSYHFCEAL
jgi:ABC-type phosphate transport system substrate-binding protein